MCLFSTGFKSGRLRSTLVVFQFSISIFLIISTIIIYNQLQYIRHKDIGFDRDQGGSCTKYGRAGQPVQKHFGRNWMRIGGVENVTMTTFLPTNSTRSEAPMFMDPYTGSEKSHIATNMEYR